MKEIVAGQDGSYVKAHDITFDAAKIEGEIRQLISSADLPIDRTYTLRHRGIHAELREQLLDFPGSLGKSINGIQDVMAKEFQFLISALKGSYTEEVINTVTELSPFSIGRVRWAYLRPVSTYSLHFDRDPVRFHIPLKTHPSALLIVNDLVFRMPEVGRLYSLQTNILHMAVNAHLREERIHLLFDTYE